MIDKIINNRWFFTLTGVMIITVSSYFLFKSGYHVLFYSETWGLDKYTFGYPRPYLEVVTVFLFWLLVFVGGIGVSTGKRKGLFLGLIAACVAIIPSLVYVVIAVGKVRTYSRSILINNLEREMTNLEKWNIIYADLFFSICLTLIVITAFILIIKRRVLLRATEKTPNHNQTYSA